MIGFICCLGFAFTQHRNKISHAPEELYFCQLSISEKTVKKMPTRLKLQQYTIIKDTMWEELEDIKTGVVPWLEYARTKERI